MNRFDIINGVDDKSRVDIASKENLAKNTHLNLLAKVLMIIRIPLRVNNIILDLKNDRLAIFDRISFDEACNHIWNTIVELEQFASSGENAQDISTVGDIYSWNSRLKEKCYSISCPDND